MYKSKGILESFLEKRADKYTSDGMILETVTEQTYVE